MPTWFPLEFCKSGGAHKTTKMPMTDDGKTFRHNTIILQTDRYTQSEMVKQ